MKMSYYFPKKVVSIDNFLEKTKFYFNRKHSRMQIKEELTLMYVVYYLTGFHSKLLKQSGRSQGHSSTSPELNSNLQFRSEAYPLRNVGEKSPAE